MEDGGWRERVGSFCAGARAADCDTEMQRDGGESWVRFAPARWMGRFGVVWQGLARGRSSGLGRVELGYRGA